MYRKAWRRQNWRAFMYLLSLLSKTKKVKYSNFTQEHQKPSNKLTGLPGANLTHLSWLGWAYILGMGRAVTSRGWAAHTAKPLLLCTARSSPDILWKNTGRASPPYRVLLGDCPCLAHPSGSSTSHCAGLLLMNKESHSCPVCTAHDD